MVQKGITTGARHHAHQVPLASYTHTLPPSDQDSVHELIGETRNRAENGSRSVVYCDPSGLGREESLYSDRALEASDKTKFLDRCERAISWRSSRPISIPFPFNATPKAFLVVVHPVHEGLDEGIRSSSIDPDAEKEATNDFVVSRVHFDQQPSRVDREPTLHGGGMRRH
jgi:hypothetical protein